VLLNGSLMMTHYSRNMLQQQEVPELVVSPGFICWLTELVLCGTYSRLSEMGFRQAIKFGFLFYGISNYELVSTGVFNHECLTFCSCDRSGWHWVDNRALYIICRPLWASAIREREC